MTTLSAESYVFVAIVESAFVTLALAAARACAIPLRILAPQAAALLVAAAAADLWLASRAAPAPVGYGLMAGVAAVAVCGATDAVSGYVFDGVTLPGLGAILLFAALGHSLLPALAGVLAGGGVLVLLYILSLGRGLGLGDVKLACCIGAGLGAVNALVCLGIAFVAGGVYAGFLLVSRRASRGDTLRFAPYLAASMMLVALLWGAS